jgi:hypothetical protein
MLPHEVFARVQKRRKTRPEKQAERQLITEEKKRKQRRVIGRIFFILERRGTESLEMYACMNLTGTRSRRPVVMEVLKSHRSPIDATQIPDNATSQPTPDKIGENAERDGNGSSSHASRFRCRTGSRGRLITEGKSYEGHRSKCNQRPI